MCLVETLLKPKVLLILEHWWHSRLIIAGIITGAELNTWEAIFILFATAAIKKAVLGVAESHSWCCIFDAPWHQLYASFVDIGDITLQLVQSAMPPCSEKKVNNTEINPAVPKQSSTWGCVRTCRNNGSHVINDLWSGPRRIKGLFAKTCGHGKGQPAYRNFVTAQVLIAGVGQLRHLHHFDSGREQWEQKGA